MTENTTLVYTMGKTKNNLRVGGGKVSMLLTRANAKGGKPLSGYPLTEDPATGFLGYKLGYCNHCNEPVLIRTLDAREVVDCFGVSDEQYKKLLEERKPKVKFKHKLIKLLGGKVDNSEE